VWAFARLAGVDQVAAELGRRAAVETDPMVREEWTSVESGSVLSAAEMAG
jgi:hypothetical protein